MLADDTAALCAAIAAAADKEVIIVLDSFPNYRITQLPNDLITNYLIT